MATAQNTDSSNSEVDYCKILVKRFMFQVHPDFFGNFKKQKSVNEANIQKLSGLLNKYWPPVLHAFILTPLYLTYPYYLLISRSFEISNIRTLTFFLKVSEGGDEPQRVQVSITSIARLIDSITVILETIGAEVYDLYIMIVLVLLVSYDPVLPTGTGETLSHIRFVVQPEVHRQYCRRNESLSRLTYRSMRPYSLEKGKSC
jgi:hypothetical protein